ncbi:MAG: hypothetical protein QM820_58230 [Minicystis sp.]
MLTKLLACSAAMAAFALTACGSRVNLAASPTTLGAVQVRVVDAYAYGARVSVKAVVTNTSTKPVALDPEGLDVRVAGKLLDHRGGLTTSHKPITLAPGEKHDVAVEFRADHDLGELARAALVVGGVSIPANAPAKVVGEIVLSASGGM